MTVRISHTALFDPGLPFEETAMEVFRIQSIHNEVYRRYLEVRGILPGQVRSLESIPHLPIRFFRTHDVLTRRTGSGSGKTLRFLSSGTTQSNRSRHIVTDPDIYHQSLETGFLSVFGNPDRYHLFALMPREEDAAESSSLVYMADRLMEKARQGPGGFFQGRHEALADAIQRVIDAGEPFILIGVTWALVDFAEAFAHLGPWMNGAQAIVVETGGMKGRRREMIREEVHARLAGALGLQTVYSEYGMTELLSQAWSTGRGIFRAPRWMRVFTRDVNDPAMAVGTGMTGGINITDLANLNSCAFIETQDLGRMHEDGSFEVLGRFDYSDLRGCNLMAE